MEMPSRPKSTELEQGSGKNAVIISLFFHLVTGYGLTNAVFWDVAPCGSCKKMEAKRSSETSVLTKPSRRHFPEHDIFHSHRCGKVKS
jgi:hypothetical protein